MDVIPKYVLKAKDITAALWQMIRKTFPTKYRKMREEIKRSGQDRVRFEFDENFKPLGAIISV
jgi:hypothetical protein